MKIFISILFCLMLCSCSELRLSTPLYGDLNASSDYNVKIYTDVDVTIGPGGLVKIDDTTIFYLQSDATATDMEYVKQIFSERYDVYEAWMK